MPKAAMPEFYTQLLKAIAEGQGQVAVDDILQLDGKKQQVYALSRLYKSIYPRLDTAYELSNDPDLTATLDTISENAFRFDMSLAIIQESDIGLDIRNDLECATHLKRMIAHAFKEAIDLDMALTDPLMVELDNARAILLVITQAMKRIAEDSA